MKAIKNIKDIAGFEDFSSSGRANYHGFKPAYIVGDRVHSVQVMNPIGYEKKGLVSVDIDAGEYWVKLDLDSESAELYMANLEHEVVWDCFIRDDAVPQIKQVAKKIRSVGGGSFVKMVDKYGRNHETELMTRYIIEAELFNAFKFVPQGWALFSNGRLPLLPHKMKNIDQLRKILKKVDELGEI